MHLSGPTAFFATVAPTGAVLPLVILHRRLTKRPHNNIHDLLALPTTVRSKYHWLWQHEVRTCQRRETSRPSLWLPTLSPSFSLFVSFCQGNRARCAAIRDSPPRARVQARSFRGFVLGIQDCPV